MRTEIQGLLKNTKLPDVEDMPLEPIDPTEGFDEFTDDEINYLVFGVKPE